MENFDDFIYFSLEQNSNPQFGFSGYDDKDGNLCQVYKGRTNQRTGEKIPHRFKFDDAHRTIRVHKKEKCKKNPKQLIADYLRNHPECLNSPNGIYKEIDGQLKHVGYYFREINEGRDAEEAIAAKSSKIKAENIALELTGSDLFALAILCGYTGKSEQLAKHRVLEYAGANPSSFMEMHESPERNVRAALRAAVKASVVTRRGSMHAWDGVSLGVTEDDAVAKLMDDEDMLLAINKNVKAVGK